ncbi:siphovirus ReqiPepy6 Gp37-like family protein [Weissella muntiaci]|uniref:siphovirus ReqiPepy6 Gp37-like family protein n=1 Tax=Weissella muntiaci TaxID=2508881 RepID=UPI0016529799|nr:siphovirus ReqiPepy6 Gp37-like family protein [Weissella muntiaci]
MEAIEQIDIEVFNRVGDSGFNFESAALFDSAISLTINWNYRNFDDFTLKVPLTKENIQLFKAENILLLKGQFFFIDRTIVEKDDDGFATVSGKSIAAKLDTRIIMNTYSTDSRLVERVVADLIQQHAVNPSDEKRKLAYLTLSDNIDGIVGENIAYQKTYGDVLEEITTLMTTYDFGFKEVPVNYINPVQQIVLFKGNDLSDTIEFSKEFDNLTKESFENAVYDERDTAYVLGEGEGNDRKGVYIGTQLSGIERRELYVDARDLQHTVKNDDGSETELNDDQYTNALIQRGKDKLAERMPVLEVNGIVNLNSELFEFRKDYNVGDRVRISSTLFSMAKTAILSSVEEVWDSDGHTMTPTFGNESPTIKDIIKRGN